MQRSAATFERDVVVSVDASAETRIDFDHLPLVPVGQELTEHEVYIDVMNPGHGPFRALSGQTAGSGHGYVPEADVDATVWDRLIRADGEARLAAEIEAEAVANGQSWDDQASGHA